MQNYLATFSAGVFGCLVLLTLTGFGQCPVSNFTVSASACRTGPVEVTNLSTGATDYYWDFCADDLQASPTVNGLTTSSSILSPYGYKTVFDNGKWYGFIADRGSRKIFRIDYGIDLENPDPTYVEVTGAGALFNSPTIPEDIDLLEVNDNWFAVVARDGFGTVVLLDFGSNIENANPTFTTLGNFGIGTKTRGLELAYDAPNSRIIMVLTASTQFLTIVDLGSSFYNAGVTSLINITGASPIISGIDLIQTCNNWFLFAATYGFDKIHQVSFGIDIMAAPTSTITYALGLATEPWEMDAVREGDKTYLLVSDLSGSYQLVDFGKIELNETPILVPGANPSSVRFTAADVVAYKGKYIVHGLNLSQAILNRVTFSNECGASQSFSALQSPPVTQYLNSGTHKILLRVANAGQVSEISQTTTISVLDAPDISISSTNNCLGNEVFFSATNSSGGLTTYSWNFGDTNTSTQQNPTHQYTAVGDYAVNLEVTASNGCTNLARDTITIYNPPVSSFTLPATTPICTNQPYGFTNTSTYDAGSNPTWDWQINGASVSTSLDLTHTFATNDPQEIKLIASIPGCNSESVQNLNTIEIGPLANFSAPDGCEDSPIQFTNTTTGAVTAINWDFDDGNFSTQENPAHTFADFATYQVTLQTENAAGCQNSITQPIAVYSNPQPDFSLALPPFSCTGTMSQFTDLTPSPPDSNLDSWSWSFGDAQSGTSTQQNAQYTYSAAGDYTVDLTVSTNFGCVASTQKTITIAQGPTASFMTTAACASKPTQLTDTSSGSITSWLWNVGTTHTYSEQNPTHVFISPGDYNVDLTVTTSNNCVSTSSQVISVPVPPALNFSIINPCAGQATQFADTTVPTADPPQSWTWDFAGEGAGTGVTAGHEFIQPSTYPVTLGVTNQSGCTYSLSNNVLINPSPTASFSATPIAGPAPLEVQFTNSSTGATGFEWRFNDSGNTLSNETSPQFTFTALGDYLVELTATNEAGCASTLSEIVSVIIPSLDLVLVDLQLVPNASSGTQAIVVEVKNNSNYTINEIDVRTELSGGIVLSETLSTILAPGSTKTFTLSNQLLTTQSLEFVCVNVEAAEDKNLLDNKRCVNLANQIATIHPYPNPNSGSATFEWIASAAGYAEVTIYNTSGQIVYEQTIPTVSEGLNRLIMDLSSLRAGLHYLVFASGDYRKTYSLFIQP